MGQVLPGAIGPSAIIWGARFGTGAGGLWSGGRFEGTAHSAFGATHSRNLAALGDGGDDVPSLFLTLGTKLIDSITDSIDRLFRLGLFHGHEKQTRCAELHGTSRSSLQ
jgi:hypothetical protein